MNTPTRKPTQTNSPIGELKPYMCKHFKWASWTHYGSKMWEYACKLKGGKIGTCKGCCEKFERKITDERK